MTWLKSTHRNINIAEQVLSGETLQSTADRFGLSKQHVGNITFAMVKTVNPLLSSMIHRKGVRGLDICRKHSEILIKQLEAIKYMPEHLR